MACHLRAVETDVVRVVHDGVESAVQPVGKGAGIPAPATRPDATIPVSAIESSSHRIEDSFELPVRVDEKNGRAGFRSMAARGRFDAADCYAPGMEAVGEILRRTES